MANVVLRDKKTGQSMGSLYNRQNSGSSATTRNTLQAARPAGYQEARAYNRSNVAQARKDLAHGKINNDVYEAIEFGGVGNVPVPGGSAGQKEKSQDQVDTAQPSPTTVGVQAPNAPVQSSALAETNAYEKAHGLPITNAAQAQTAQTAATDMASRYRQGLSAVQGTQAPDTQGAAAGAIGAAIPPPSSDMSVVDTMLSEDAGFKGLQEMYNDYFHPDNQKTSLVKEYKKLYKDSGLNELDEEILDAKTIIEGTEDDIRNEIQQAGGFGTDSQIQALASSRNKVLLKNYNNLVAMREMKEKNFDTMVNLAEKDRAYADQKAEQMMNFQFKVLDYKQKFVDNTRDNLNKMLDRDPVALYNSYARDPRQMAFAEQILGIGSGGLQQVAQNYSTQLALDTEAKRAQINSANRANQPDVIDNDIKTERDNKVLTLAKELLSDDAVGKGSAVGSSLAKLVPGGMYFGLQPNRSAFEARVNSLKANLTLDNLKLLKGAMSDKDLAFLQSVGSSISTGMSEDEFNKEVRNVIRTIDPTDSDAYEADTAITVK